ncbi:MAG: HigA family addiction module antidote protein [Victivallales bacterium]|nr:HigA family addiction module antidote protein [Victivallales bacterium]
MKAQKQYTSPVPYHPGEMLQEKLEEMELTPAQFAKAASIDLKTLNDFLNQTIAVTPTLAIALEKSTGIPVHLWTNLQNTYDKLMSKNERRKKLPWSAAAL